MDTSSFDKIHGEIQILLQKMTAYSEQAKFDPFMEFYNNDPSFIHISADGSMRNYHEFREICSEYYNNIALQKIVTLNEKINVIGLNIVVTGWTGKITALFKNGDTIIMNNYSVSNLFNKINGNWKIIQSHESSLPPEIIKKN